MWEIMEVQKRSMGLNNSENKKSIDSSIVSEKIVTGGIPLMLVKPINSIGPLSISDTPVALEDIPKTIADSYGIANNYSGESILDNNNTSERIRLYYHYDWSHDYWDKQYLPPITEYQINGFSWDSVSWKQTYRIFTSSGMQYILPTYQPGTNYSVWNRWRSRTVSWTRLEWARKRLYMDRWDPFESYSFNECTQSNLFLNLKFSPFLANNQSDHQRLNILFNGHLIKNYTISKSGSQTIIVEIDCTLFSENIQTVNFELPDAISPDEIGNSKIRGHWG